MNKLAVALDRDERRAVYQRRHRVTHDHGTRGNTTPEGYRSYLEIVRPRTHQAIAHAALHGPGIDSPTTLPTHELDEFANKVLRDPFDSGYFEEQSEPEEVNPPNSESTNSTENLGPEELEIAFEMLATLLDKNQASEEQRIRAKEAFDGDVDVQKYLYDLATRIEIGDHELIFSNRLNGRASAEYRYNGSLQDDNGDVISGFHVTTRP